MCRGRIVSLRMPLLTELPERDPSVKKCRLVSDIQFNVGSSKLDVRRFSDER